MGHMLDFSEASLRWTLAGPSHDDWWNHCNSLIVDAGMRRKDLEPTVAASQLDLRPGCAAFLGALRAAGVPVCVVSAGFSDVIESFLASQGVGLSSKSVHRNFKSLGFRVHTSVT